MACASPAAADRPPPPKLPLAQWWSVALDGAVSAGPVADGSRVYLALASGHLLARDAADGHEIWRHDRIVSAPLAAAGDLLFVVGAEAVDAIQGATGKSAWVLPRVKAVAPLALDAGVLYVVTDSEVIAARATNGEVIWRHPAGGVHLAPAIEGGRVYVGADDGRVMALEAKDGAVAWDSQFLTGGVTAIAASRGRVYAGSGDKRLFCLDGVKKGTRKWDYDLGAQAVGHIAVDDDRVYVGALNNVVRALDRQNGNQRWQMGLAHRPSFGVFASGHVVFVPAVGASQVQMIYDHGGGKSGTLDLPGEGPPGLPPAIGATPDGPVVYAVTGGLTNEWSLTKFAPAGETVLFAFAKLDSLPGLPYLTDPALTPIGNVLKTMLLGDPLLQALGDADWPIVMRDPPLVPLTVLPGLQLRPLSPVLPVRSSGRGPGG